MKKCRLGITSRALGKETRTLDDICNFMLMSCTSFLIDLLINGTKRLRLIMQGRKIIFYSCSYFILFLLLLLLLPFTLSSVFRVDLQNGEEAPESRKGAKKKTISKDCTSPYFVICQD